MSAWRGSERSTASLERRLGEERRARSHVESQLQRQRSARQDSGECENSWCVSRRAAAESETATLRRDLQRAREAATALQRDLNQATEQVRNLETRERQDESNASSANGRMAGALTALHERAAHLERALSAETRVKLDLLSALGDAKRHMQIQQALCDVTLGTCRHTALHERAAHLERALSAETRVKLDLLSALGDAKRHMQIQQGRRGCDTSPV
ncbi:macoilin-like [Ostrinia nubilalis]|uniref:macoilin-like n=1 Tax=Ostrinia nubilalis TaxID=29057 RepID=UPI00308232E6